jgi:hypothetical protein
MYIKQGVCVCVYIYVCVCVCVYVYIYVCVCVCRGHDTVLNTHDPTQDKSDYSEGKFGEKLEKIFFSTSFRTV